MRRSFLPIAALGLALVMVVSACDTTPPSPTPVPSPTTGPTATTQQATPTTQSSVQQTGPTAATKGSLFTTKNSLPSLLGSQKKGNTKGTVTNRTITKQTAQRSLPLGAAPEAAGTKTPVKGATPTGTVPAVPSGIPDGWGTVIDSDFSGNDAGSWLTGDTDYTSVSVDNGTLNLTAKQGYMGWTWPDEASDLTDGYISATIQLKGNGDGGVMVRYAQADDGTNSRVMCVIDNKATYGCYAQVSGKWTDVGSGNASVIKKNAQNTIVLRAIGPSYTLWINGKQIKSFTDKGAVTEGAWGVAGESASDTDPGTTAMFGHILIAAPGVAGETPTEVATQEATSEVPTEQPTEAATEVATEVPTEEATTEVPTEQPTEAATEVPTEEATTAPVVTPTSGGGSVIVSTDFTKEEGTWLTGEGNGFSASIENGALALKQENPGGILIDAPEEAMDVADAKVSADMTVEDASKDTPGIAGVMARSQALGSGGQDWSQVICGIDNSTDYVCVLVSKDGQNVTRLLGGQSNAIQVGKKNTLTLTGQGSKWTFAINGTRIGTFTNSTVKTGAWGVFVIAGNDAITARYSKITISKP